MTMATIWWSVLIETEPGDGVTDDAIDTLVDLLADHHGSVAGGRGHGYSARISIEAADAITAIRKAAAVVTSAAERSDLPALPIVRAEATREDIFEAELERPSFPELLGVSEAAAVLGVSRQRLAEIRHKPDFPQPIFELAAGPIWLRPAVASWADTWERKPGRPRTRVVLTAPEVQADEVARATAGYFPNAEVHIVEESEKEAGRAQKVTKSKRGRGSRSTTRS